MVVVVVGAGGRGGVGWGGLVTVSNAVSEKARLRKA